MISKGVLREGERTQQSHMSGEARNKAYVFKCVLLTILKTNSL